MQLRVKMPQNSINNIFTSRRTTNKAPSKIFRGFEVGKKVRVFFQSQRTKSKVNATFSAVKNKE